MKVKSSDILKPGAKLEVKLIDFNDPEIKRFVEEALKQQKAILKIKNGPYENYKITI